MGNDHLNFTFIIFQIDNIFITKYSYDGKYPGSWVSSPVAWYIWINNEPLGTRFNPTRGKLPDHLIRTTTNNTAQPRRGGPLSILFVNLAVLLKFLLQLFASFPEMISKLFIKLLTFARFVPVKNLLLQMRRSFIKWFCQNRNHGRVGPPPAATSCPQITNHTNPNGIAIK